MMACTMPYAVFQPAVMVAKILAFMEEWIEELALRSGQCDIPAVMSYRHQTSWSFESLQ